MNKRIQKLAEQVGFSFRVDNATDDEIIRILKNADRVEKFAELIVKDIVEECAKVCVEHAGWTPRMIAEQVKQHFGVE